MVEEHGSAARYLFRNFQGRGTVGLKQVHSLVEHVTRVRCEVPAEQKRETTMRHPRSAPTMTIQQ